MAKKEALRELQSRLAERLQAARTLLVDAKSGFSPVGTEHAVGMGA